MQLYRSIRRRIRLLFRAPENVRQCVVGCRPARRPSLRTDSNSRVKWRHSTTEVRTSRQTRGCGWTRRCCGSQPDRNCRSIPTERPHTDRQQTVSLRPAAINLPQRGGGGVGGQYAGDVFSRQPFQRQRRSLKLLICHSAIGRPYRYPLLVWYCVLSAKRTPRIFLWFLFWAFNPNNLLLPILVSFMLCPSPSFSDRCCLQ